MAAAEEETGALAKPEEEARCTKREFVYSSHFILWFPLKWTHRLRPWSCLTVSVVLDLAQVNAPQRPAWLVMG